jgi:hypothetical protein
VCNWTKRNFFKGRSPNCRKTWKSAHHPCT